MLQYLFGPADVAPNLILFLTLSFQFDMTAKGIDYSKVFSLNPSHNIIYAGDKPHTVTVIFKPDREIEVKDPPVLKCQVNKCIYIYVYFYILIHVS